MAVALLGASSAPQTVHAQLPSMGPDTSALSGNWRATAVATQWNGNFTMILKLQQLGDSLQGTYELGYSGRVVEPPVDLYGHVQNGRLSLHDRGDQFLFEGRASGSHLNGRLAHGSRERASAVSITFNRVVDQD